MPRRPRTNYVPLLTIGIFALTLFAWLQTKPPHIHPEGEAEEVREPVPTSSKPTAESADEAASPRSLSWQVEQGFSPERAALAACLLDSGFQGPRV
ncbi:MAG: hypothetical protein VX589_13400, partial [Myxococcota bacterium]|nr:hypothetical protein [Myxococcota bacterium]